MKSKLKGRLLSLTTSVLLICGGVTLTVLLIIVSEGPGFPKTGIVKNIIIVYTSLSYLSAGFLGAVACFFGHKSWLYGLHISLEVLFLLFSGIGFITFHKTMHIYFKQDCHSVNTTCVCKGTDLMATCDVVFTQEDLVAIVNILDVATWLILFFDFVVSTYLSFCSEDPQPPGETVNVTGDTKEHSRSIYTVSSTET